MTVVRIKTVRESMPQPVWDWDGVKWVLTLKKTRRMWDRPVLPPHVPVRTPLKTKGAPLWLMGRPDRERAEVVLAIYLRSMGLDDWFHFKESGPGYAFYAYPGPPVDYPESEVVRVACCLGKNHRYIMPEYSLRNPVEYCFCLTHWHHFLQESSERDRTLEVPPLYTWVSGRGA
jgi:hypothetical protein